MTGRRSRLSLDLSWMAEAACADAPVRTFFSENPARTAAAKAICAGCPVREACRDYALATREPHGVWGGLTEAERRRLLRGGDGSHSRPGTAAAKFDARVVATMRHTLPDTEVARALGISRRQLIRLAGARTRVEGVA